MNGPKREIFYVSWHSETNLKVQCTHRYWVWYEGSTFLLHGFDRFLTRTLSYNVCPLIDHMNKNVGHENWFILWSNTLSAYWKRFSIFYKYILLFHVKCSYLWNSTLILTFQSKKKPFNIYIPWAFAIFQSVTIHSYEFLNGKEVTWNYKQIE